MKGRKMGWQKNDSLNIPIFLPTHFSAFESPQGGPGPTTQVVRPFAVPFSAPAPVEGLKSKVTGQVGAPCLRAEV